MSVRPWVRGSVSIKEKPPGDASYCPPGLVIKTPRFILEVYRFSLIMLFILVNAWDVLPVKLFAREE